MPRAKKPAPIADDRPEIVQQLLAQYGQSGYRSDVKRLTLSRPQRWESLGRIDLTTNLEDDVRQLYGGGDFKCYTLESDGTYVKGAIIPLTIGGPPKFPSEPGTESTELARLEAKIAELSAAKSDDGTERMIKLFAMVTAAAAPIVTGLVGLLKDNNRGGGDVVETLRLVQDAETRGEERGKQLGTLIAGGAEPGLGATAAQYLSPLLELAKMQMAKSRHPGQPVGTTPVVMTPPPGTAVPSPATPNAGEVLQREYDFLPTLRPHYPALYPHAQADTDPGIVADFSLTYLSEDLMEAARAAVLREDFKPTMRAEFTAVQLRDSDGNPTQVVAFPAAWVEKYLECVIFALSPDEPPPAKGGKKR